MLVVALESVEELTAGRARDRLLLAMRQAWVFVETLQAVLLEALHPFQGMSQPLERMSLSVGAAVTVARPTQLPDIEWLISNVSYFDSGLVCMLCCGYGPWYGH